MGIKMIDKIRTVIRSGQNKSVGAGVANTSENNREVRLISLGHMLG